MSNLPRRAQLYLALVYLLGALSALAAAFAPIPKADAQWWELGLYLLSNGLFPKRQPVASASLFNLALSMLEAWTAGLVVLCG